MHKYLFILGLVLLSCNQNLDTKYEVKIQTHKIVKKLKKNPTSIYEEISPKYVALLSNGDTVPCYPNARIGSTVYYKFYKLKK